MPEQKRAQTDFSFIYFLLVCLLGLVVLGESLIIINLVSQKPAAPVPESRPLVKVTPSPSKTMGGGSMSLVLLDKGEVVVGKDLRAQLIFNSPSTPVGGVDAILTFDPKLIAVKTISPNTNLFVQIPVNRNLEKQGRIKITAYQPKKVLLGSSVLATLTLRLLKNEQGELALEFVGVGNKKDSNLISQTDPQDILKSVMSLSLEPTGR